MVTKTWKTICLFGLVTILFSLLSNVLFYYTMNGKIGMREGNCNDKDMWKKNLLSRAMQTDSKVSEVLDVLHKLFEQHSNSSSFGLMTINSTILSNNNVNEKLSESEKEPQQACKQARLELFNKDIDIYFNDIPEIRCNDEPNWIHFLDGGRIKLVIPPNKRDKLNRTTCNIVYIFRKDDFGTTYSKSFIIHENEVFALQYDFFKLKCNDLERTTHESFHAGVVKRRPRFDSMSVPRGLGYNVLMIGFDSVSRMNFERKCKESYKYLTKTMDANILDGYNIVGDGTPQALIPILTGTNEIELPTVLKRETNPSRVDVYPFIWKDFMKNGYVTAYSEDSPYIGTFTYRMTGFKKKPTDHYMRPFYLAIWPHLYKHDDLCLNSKRRSQVFLNWMQNIHSTYKNQKIFAFGFLSEFSHNEPNRVQLLDRDLLHFLTDLNSNKQLKDTILIIMSDHGLRFGGFRETVQGKMEERRPFFAFVFPESFKLKNAKAYKNFRDNTKQLTTPYDIYYTLKDLIEFDGDGIGNTTNRGISLFKKIPLSRTCSEAGIDPHWCTCLTWNKINQSELVVRNASEVIVDFINNITSSVRHLCQKMKLQKVLEAFVISPHTNLLRFKKSRDEDGRVPDLSSDTNEVTFTYQIVLKTEPGGGMFEATVDFDKRTEKYSVKLENISRINKYGDSPKCVERQHENLRKYCVCIKT